MFDFLSKKFSSIFSRVTGKAHLSEDNIQEALAQTKDALLEADVPHQLVETFAADIKAKVVGQKVHSSLKPGEQLIKIVHDTLLDFFGGKGNTVFSFQIPSVTMVMGLQGSGKTTTIAKLAHHARKQAEKRGKTRRILVGSVDFYRPAAIDQLEILAGQVGADFYRSTQTDPVAAARDIYAAFKQGQYDLLFLDTAGRLHVDEQMMQELKAIDAQVSPKHKLLVLDAMTGQESLRVAQAFEQEVGFHAAILSKMDSDARGGAAFAFRYELKKPIIFVGIGEKVDELEAFHPERVVKRLLGMGDLVTLIERANEKVKSDEQEKIYRSIGSGTFTLQDFANQMSMMKKIGSLGQIAQYMPGMGTMNLSPDKIEQGESDIKKFRALIDSMTNKERLYPKLLDGSRKQRIAKGAGATVTDVNLLLQRFEQSQQFVKLFKRFGRFQNFFGQ